MSACELEFRARQEIDVGKAREQHAAYEARLTECGVQVVSLPADPEYPDSVFVEDPAIVLDEVAVITRLGVESRRGEAASAAAALAPYRELRYLQEPATAEGGDVLRVGKTLYVGASRRTNQAGLAALTEIAGSFGYAVVPVAVHGCLHLKTACCVLPDGAFLVNRNWIDVRPLRGGLIDVPGDEVWGANVLGIGDSVFAPISAPRTCELLMRLGFKTRALDISEFQKAEAGLTCLSIVFE